MDDESAMIMRPPVEPKVETFSSGAKRSTSKPPYTWISVELLKRVAAVWQAGAVKYGKGNWQKGGEDFISDIPNHCLEHLYSFLAGDATEDHLAHLVCNVQMLIDFQAVFSHGQLTYWEPIKGVSKAS